MGVEGTVRRRQHLWLGGSQVKWQEWSKANQENLLPSVLLMLWSVAQTESKRWLDQESELGPAWDFLTVTRCSYIDSERAGAAVMWQEITCRGKIQGIHVMCFTGTGSDECDLCHNSRGDLPLKVCNNTFIGPQMSDSCWATCFNHLLQVCSHCCQTDWLVD